MSIQNNMEFNEEKHFWGKPCKHGHVDEVTGLTARYKNANQNCVTCNMIKGKAYREANKDYRKAYYEANKENELAHARSYREANKIKLTEIKKAYYERNKDVLKAIMRKWYHDNKDQQREYKRVYFQSPNGREINRKIRRKRRALKNDAFIMNASIQELLPKTLGNCLYCGKQCYSLNNQNVWEQIKGVEAHVDHFVPLSKGGIHAPGNLAITCADCNLSKGARLDIKEWFLSKPFGTLKKWKQICKIMNFVDQPGIIQQSIF